MKSHSDTCHLTQVNVPCLNPSQTGPAWFIYPRGMEGWVDRWQLLCCGVL